MGKMNYGEMNAEQHLLHFIKWATELSPEEKAVCEMLDKNEEENKKRSKEERKIAYRQRVRENRELRQKKKMIKKYRIPTLKLPKIESVGFIKDPLTQTEREVLNDLKEGLSPNEIASKRTISLTTIKTHINNIYTKKQVHNLQQLLVKEFKNDTQNRQNKIQQGLKILNMKI